MRRIFISALTWAMVACGDDGSADAAMDTGRIDAAPDSAPADTAVVCDPLCNRTERCCDDEAGGVMCIPVVDDDLNCGGCGITCADGRGTDCDLGACVCGSVLMGCLGTERSWCCPPRNPGGTEYCADFTTDSQDCGGCGAECAPEVASDCAAGECLCGDEGRGCAGTAEDSCCVAVTGTYSCVDTMSDSFHCGGCGRTCMTGERCEMGSCALGASCAEACARGQICCDGACCERISCTRGEC